VRRYEACYGMALARFEADLLAAWTRSGHMKTTPIGFTGRASWKKSDATWLTSEGCGIHN